MTVIRIQKTDNYSVISNEHLRNKDLSLKAKGLMTLMLSLPPQWDFSIGGLVAICKESHTSIRSAIKELEENRYLIRERKNNEKGYFVYEYTLFETQQPHVEKQHMDKKDADKQHTAKRRQINKDVVKKDKVNKDVIKKDKTKEIESMLESVNNPDLIILYRDYIKMRQEIGAPLTKLGLEKLIDRCERLSKNNIRIQKVLLETALINNWKNIYLPREEELKAITNETIDDLRSMFGLE